jgi:hypothetical protein
MIISFESHVFFLMEISFQSDVSYLTEEDFRNALAVGEINE